MFLKCYLQEAGAGRKRRREHMRRLQAWQYLIGIFAVFWVIFATVLIISAFPFYVISIALTTITMLSLLIIALAWAYTHDY
jgi:hypothetical protein